MEHKLQPIHMYFTFWNFVFVCLHKWTHRHIDLLFTSMFVMIGGFFAVHLNHMLEQNNSDTYFYSFLLVLIDILFHTIPFVFIFIKYHSHYKKLNSSYPVMISVLIVLVYILQVNIQQTYYIHQLFMTFVFILSFIAYLAIKLI